MLQRTLLAFKPVPVGAKLPFQLMSITRYENFTKFVQDRPGNSSEALPPFFVSPKSDGIRCVSYPWMAKPSMFGKGPVSALSSCGGAAPGASPKSSTCFTRYGRLVVGLERIESELRELRRIAGDEGLVVDGELIIERPPSTVAAAQELHDFSAIFGVVKSLASMAGTSGADEDPAQGASSSSTTRKTGMLSLPPEQRIAHVKFVVFDIIRYTPPTRGRATGAPAVEAGKTPFYSRLMTMRHLFRELERSRTTSGTTSTSKATKAIPPAKKVGGVVIPSPKSPRMELAEYRLIAKLADAKSVVLPEYLRHGYEGAVVRSAMNLYKTEQEISNSKKSRGNRSPSAAKIVPLYDKEYQIFGFDGLSASGKSLGNLICMTPTGKTFKVPTNALTESQQQQIIAQLRMARSGGGGRGGSGIGAIGLFVTLQYPCLMPSGIPRFPRIKSVRGKKGSFI